MSDPEPPSTPASASIRRAYLTQKFARLEFSGFSVVGYSVAGEETVVQTPELNVCFDIGRCPYFALTSDYLCVTHGHMDHIAGLGYYVSQRVFQGMKPATILAPREHCRPLDELLRSFAAVERQRTPYTIIPMDDGVDFSPRRDLLIRPLATHHAGGSLGYSILSVREKLKPEYHGLTPAELVRLKRQGVEIQYRLEVPLLTFLGDTTSRPGPRDLSSVPVFTRPEVVNAQVLLTECTFFEQDHMRRAKHGKHLHVEDFVELLPTLACQHVVLMHLSRRTALRRARSMLKKMLPADQFERVTFLMDLQHADHAGELEAPALPNDDV